MSSATHDLGRWVYFYVYQSIGATATSSGAYLRFYLPPQVERASNFDPVNDCRINNNVDSCDITFNQTSNYLRVTVKGKGTYSTSNIFPHNTGVNIYLRNILFPPSSNKVVYPVYATLYKSDVPNTV